MENKHLIVVSVIEGRNIVRSQHGTQHVYIEARFNGEILSSDPVPLENTCPQFLTELCWELDRKCLHLFRMERKPIKLMCYALDIDSLEKHFIGYIVLDIRLAQEVAKQKFEWKPLLNSKFRGSPHQRPELLMSIQLSKSDETEDSLSTQDQAIRTGASVTLESRNGCTASYEDHDLVNDIKVRLLNGRYNIWDSKCDSEQDLNINYKLSVTIVFASNLYKLVKFPAKLEEQLTFHFKLNLFGSAVETEAFTDLRSCEIPIEKISFKVATINASTLHTYFQLNPTLEIQLCDNRNELLGFVTISLNRLYNDNEDKFTPIENQFRLLPYDDGLSSDPPHPNIGVIVEIEEEQRSVPNTANRQLNKIEEEITGDSPSTPSQQHYCFAVDIRSMSFADKNVLPLKGCFIQYSYAFFGFMDKIKTSRVAVEDTSTVVFDDGFCAFNFATSESQLEQTLKKIPLMLEVIEKSSINTLLGTSKVFLSDILNVIQDNEGKKLLSFDAPVLNSSKDKIGNIQLIMCLQNWGEAKIGHLPQSLPQINLNNSVAVDSSLNVDTLLMEAAYEIEMWKEQQITKFTEELKKKEAQYLEALEGKFNEKSGARESELKQKMSELLKLEDRLKGLLEEVSSKETRLNSKEYELSEKQVLLKTRFEKLDNEISEAISELKLNFEDKYNDAKDKLKSYQEDNIRLQQKVSMLEKKLKERDIMIKSIEDKVGKGSIKPIIRSRKSVGDSNVKSPSKGSNNAQKSKIGNDLKKQNGYKASQKTSAGTRNEILSNGKNEINGKTKDRKTIMLEQIKKEKEELLKRGISCDDPIIKEIDSQLQKHGFKMK